jgi:antitoxin HigA-1
MTRPAIHPGEILADELQGLGMSAAELAQALHVPTNRMTQILNGQRGITADTALRLGQKSYELRLAEQQAGEEIQRTIQRRSMSHELQPMQG